MKILKPLQHSLKIITLDQDEIKLLLDNISSPYSILRLNYSDESKTDLIQYEMVLPLQNKDDAYKIFTQE